MNKLELPEVPYPFTAANFRIARAETVDFISFVASNHPPQIAEEEIFRAARQLINIIKSEYEQAARELLEDPQA